MSNMFKVVILISFLYATNCAETPIIGILTQPSDYYDYDTFIAASYVKFVESAGARVIPIWINQSIEYYERVVSYTNGVLFPGGAASLVQPGGYGDTAKIIYRLAVNLNKEGNYYPIWGTCLGFEVIPYVEVGVDTVVNCSVSIGGQSLNFKRDFRESRLFQNLSEEIFEILSSKNVTYNYHDYCLTSNSLFDYGIFDWKIITTNKDNNGLEYISTMENLKYPFYAVQYHPEKNGYEFAEGYHFPHEVYSIKIMQYYANFFVHETRKNQNSFPNTELVLKSLIYNYNTKFSGRDQNYYYMMYGFYETDYENNQLV
ncbi:gamma-glutamyl hydrolase-like [Diabrotica undecimpunctata]|uniref:gamma-glutamyl hydrolase-like n=1 Tax=Diabrotica undecimpunctata TaxID=50387 RepID=UPI003B631A63